MTTERHHPTEADKKLRERINWDLINQLATKPHPLLHIVAGEQYGVLINGVFDHCLNGVGEVMQEARSAHHLLDMAGIPRGDGYSSNLDSRMYVALAEIIDLRNRLDRIAGWHSRETADGGMVGDYCIECGGHWPCETRRMADGSHEDLTEREGDT